jgi:hypothetical protein
LAAGLLAGFFATGLAAGIFAAGLLLVTFFLAAGF